MNKSLVLTEMPKALFALFALLLFTASPAIAHSGGTDANGCHAGKKPYHWHR